VRVLVEIGHVDSNTVEQVLHQTEMRVEDELGRQADSSTGNHKRREHSRAHQIPSAQRLIEQHGQKQTQYHRADHRRRGEHRGVEHDLPCV
jgi:hypothetical protein